MVDAAIGHGSDFLRGDGAGPEVFATVGELTDISPPSFSRDVVEKTHMSSPEKWREFIAGLKDGGEATIEFNFDAGDATVTALHTDLNTDTPKNYKCTFPDASEWPFSAFLTGIETGVGVEGKMTGSATFKLTGKPALIA